ncbi:zinc finger BED domain-containing protein 4-like [Bacillus rossius redtenbacheri]|uniref:zinc finger BED domain-containing protein 4-like n=1 Tax=Bacillus rossius redtenbacheri TaxID=93214 RepID=UPI002FDECF31
MDVFVRPGTSQSDEHKSRADIWEFFEKIDHQTARCKCCKKIYKTPSSSTSSLIRHLDVHFHLKRQYEDKKKDKKSKCVGQPSIIQSFEAKTMLLHDSSRSKTITSKIAHMLALDYQPFSIVNDRGFRELINFLEPRYSIPSRKHFSKTVVPKLYADTRGKVAESLQCELQTAQSFSWTLDIWTSRAQVPFISLTAHYLNAEFCLQNRTLDCSHFPGEHTGAAIYEKICHLTADWKISALLISVPVYVVSDNARNIKAALTGKPVEHLFCVAHTLQLAIDNAVTQVGMGKILKKCRSIVGHYKQSSKASERLHSLQSKLGLPEHSLCQMVETRWDSVYIMLERLQEQKESISADLPNTVKDSLTTQEWRLIEGYVTILKPLFLATKELCREDSPTISIVRPLLFSIEGYLKKLFEFTFWRIWKWNYTGKRTLQVTGHSFSVYQRSTNLFASLCA